MWEARWVNRDTRWDQAKPHTVFVKFLNGDASDAAGVPRSGRAFVPGCGGVSASECVAERQRGQLRERSGQRYE